MSVVSLLQLVPDAIPANADAYSARAGKNRRRSIVGLYSAIFLPHFIVCYYYRVTTTI